MPTYFTHIKETVSETTAGFQWIPGFDGGLEQKFYVFYKKASDLLWNFTVVLTNKVILTGLAPGTLYNVKMFASNSLGNSSESSILNFTTNAGESITYFYSLGHSYRNSTFFSIHLVGKKYLYNYIEVKLG